MIWALVVVSGLYGCIAALAFGRFSDTVAVRRTVNCARAHLMELSLFLDSPSLVLRAQRELLGENLRLLWLLLPSSMIPLAIFVILFPQLDAMFGHEPLRVGESTVVTAQWDGAAPSPGLEVPAGIVVETPAAGNVHDREVSWRLRPLGRTSGELKVHYGDGRVLTGKVVAGAGLIYGWTLPFVRPAIEIRYPRAYPAGLNWMVCFFVISTAAAIGYRR